MSKYHLTIKVTVEREQALRQSAHDVAVENGATHDAKSFLDPSVRSVEDCLYVIYESLPKPGGVSVGDLYVDVD